MLTLLNYLPHILFGALALFALVMLFSDDGKGKRSRPQRPRRQYYTWNDRSAHRD